MAAAHSGVNQSWLFGFCWNFFLGNKIFHARKDLFRDEGASFGGYTFEECRERSFRHISSEAVTVILDVPKNRFKKRHTSSSFGLASNLTLANESSKIPRSGNTSVKHFKGSNVKKSRRFAWCPIVSGIRVGFMIRVGS